MSQSSSPRRGGILRSKNRHSAVRIKNLGTNVGILKPQEIADVLALLGSLK